MFFVLLHRYQFCKSPFISPFDNWSYNLNDEGWSNFIMGRCYSDVHQVIIIVQRKIPNFKKEEETEKREKIISDVQLHFWYWGVDYVQCSARYYPLYTTSIIPKRIELKKILSFDPFCKSLFISFFYNWSYNVGKNVVPIS